MRSWNYKLLCGTVCLAQLACLSLPVWAAQNSAAFTRQTTLQQLRDDPAIKSSGYYTYCRELWQRILEEQNAGTVHAPGAGG